MGKKYSINSVILANNLLVILLHLCADVLVGLLRAGVNAELELTEEWGSHHVGNTITFLAKGVHGFFSLRLVGLVFLLFGAHIGAG